MRATVVLVLASLLGALGCNRPSAPDCERLCWGYNELHFWDRFDKDAQSLDPAARAKLRAERQSSWDEMKKRELDPGLENCTKSCRRGGDNDAVRCMDAARTAADSEACLK